MKGNLLVASSYCLVLLSALPPMSLFSWNYHHVFVFSGITIIAITENYCFANDFGKYIWKSLGMKIAAMGGSCY